MAQDHDDRPAPEIKTVATIMRDLDLCMMATLSSEDGRIVSRPMSNNRQVTFDGDSWFFSHGDTRKVQDLREDPAVVLDFQGDGVWLSIEGEAELHSHDRALFEKHWTPDLERWFEQGLDTPGLTLIAVRGERATLWGRAGDGVVDLTAR